MGLLSFANTMTWCFVPTTCFRSTSMTTRLVWARRLKSIRRSSRLSSTT